MSENTKFKRTAKDLMTAWIGLNYNEDRCSFAQLCDLWILERKQRILKEEEVIETINAVYSEYLKSGEQKFIKEYAKFDRQNKEYYKDIKYRQLTGKKRSRKGFILKANP